MVKSEMQKCFCRNEITVAIGKTIYAIRKLHHTRAVTAQIKISTAYHYIHDGKFYVLSKADNLFTEESNNYANNL